MTIQIAEFQQTSAYPMESFRRAYKYAGGLTNGVLSSWSTTVTGMTLTVAAGSAIIDAQSRGLYHVENDAPVNLTVSPAHGTLPRIDSVILTVSDSDEGGASDAATLSIVAGTPQSGATLSNQLGSPSVPGQSTKICDVLVPAATSSLSTFTHLRDKSKRVRGSLRHYSNTVARSSAGFANQTTPVQATGSNSKVHDSMLRVQANGFPMKITFTGIAQLDSITTGSFPFGIEIAPVYSTDATGTAGTWAAMNFRYGYGIIFNYLTNAEAFSFDVWWTPPSIGDYLISLGFYTLAVAATTAQVSVRGTAADAPLIYVEEMTMDEQTSRL